MIDISSKCYNTEQMFTKNKQSTIIEKTVSIFLNLNKKVEINFKINLYLKPYI